MSALLIGTAVTPQATASTTPTGPASTIPSNVMEANNLIPALDSPDLPFFDFINIPPEAGQELIFRPRKLIKGDFSRANLALSLTAKTSIPRIYADDATIVGKPLIGLPAANTVSRRSGVWAADLGITWDDGTGRTMIAYGDNYGPGHLHPMSRFRGSALGYVNTRNPYNVRMTKFFTGYEDRATEIVVSEHKWGRELSKIPTAAIALGRTQYIDFMSVRQWGDPGEWTTNWSRIYKSTDYGRTWTPTEIMRPNRGGFAKFQMGAFVRVGDYVYEFGTHNGRLGDAYLSRVKVGQFEKLHAWRYWNGRKWVHDPAAATPVVPGRVSELSVQWNPTLRRFMLLTLGVGDAIYLRYSKDLIKWTNKYQLIPEQSAKVYSPYFLPHQNGRNVFFTLSTWFPYTVSTVKARIPSAAYMDNLPYKHYEESDWPFFIKPIIPPLR